MTHPITDEELADVRESAEMIDWCIVCSATIVSDTAINGGIDCACRERGYSGKGNVSIRSILARIDAAEGRT